jgi:excisionase family DNA binding protein
MTDPLLLKPAQVAERLGVSRETVRQMLLDGRLPYVLIGADRRIPTAAVADFVRRSTRTATK